MANLQQYSLIYCRVNGALLTEEASVDIARTTNAQLIKTVIKGFAGVSPGAPMCTIDISEMVPSADFELDPGPFMLALQPVEIGLEVAGKTATSKGFFTDDSLKHAVDSPSGATWKFVGTFPEFE